MENQKTLYTITITETRQETTLTRRDWVKGGTEEQSAGGYGYTPQVTEVKEVNRKIFEQVVDRLDIVKVINAVNFTPQLTEARIR